MHHEMLIIYSVAWFVQTPNLVTPNKSTPLHNYNFTLPVAVQQCADDKIRGRV